MMELATGWKAREDDGDYSDLTRDFPPNGGLVRGIPLFQGNLGW